MSRINLDEYLDDDAELRVRRRASRQPKSVLHRADQAKRSDHAIIDEILRHGSAEQIGDEAAFKPTFTSSKYERVWILNYLGPFYDDKLITDVLSRVKGGKEATVYCCAAYPTTGLELLAAKIYRPRAFRNLRNDARYRQGRMNLDDRGKGVRDARLLHAIRKGTDIGKEAVHTSWLEHEYETLERLHAAGADVPRPIAHGHNTILMEYLGDEERSAPALSQVALAQDEAQPLFDRLLHNVDVMLSCQRVHGDLSAYNVLYWEGDFRIIDFPQAVDPFVNPEAFDIFQRDVTRLCQYFARYGVRSDPVALAGDLWQRHALPLAADLAPMAPPE